MNSRPGTRVYGGWTYQGFGASVDNGDKEERDREPDLGIGHVKVPDYMISSRCKYICRADLHVMIPVCLTL